MKERKPQTVTGDAIEIDPDVLAEIEENTPDGFREGLDSYMSGELHTDILSFDVSEKP